MCKNVEHGAYNTILEISEELDGSGCHRTYNQLPSNPEISIKSFMLFGYKIISITNSSNPLKIHWMNSMPNSPFILRPVVLLSRKS